MIIKHITIKGFKSFGRTTTLSFSGGITAIVGPNGSGKSNVADALRWVLGEQSPKALRVKKTDDLIFAGSDGKARASVAEVSVLFDNSDGAAPLEFSEIELSRKLYGSGESDYRLNGRKVRLAEVQELLAAARLGASSYAIINQGTIDSLVLATAAERKLLFEEASGIRHFELQRGTVMKRLQATADNMQQAQAVLAELGLRLSTLERNLAAAQQRDGLERELKRLRQELAAARRAELEADHATVAVALQQAAAEVERLDAQLKKLTQQQQAAAQVDHEAQAGRSHTLQQLNRLEAEREQLLNDGSVQQAELQHLMERLEAASQQGDDHEALRKVVEQAQADVTQLGSEMAAAEAAQRACQTEREELTQAVRRLQQQLVRQRKAMQEGTQRQYVSHAQTIVDDLHRSLETETITLDQIQAIAYRVRRLLKLASEGDHGESLTQLQELQEQLGVAIQRREQIDERYTEVTLNLRRLELDVAAAGQELKRLEHELAQAKATLAGAAELRTHIEERRLALAVVQCKLDASQAAIVELRDSLAERDPQLFNQTVAVVREREQMGFRYEAACQESRRLQQERRRLDGELAALPASEGEASASAELLQRQIIQTESRLATLTELSGGIEEEYAEAKQRHDFLQQQLADLQAAEANLHTITAQLEAAIQQQFASAFSEISERFDGLFQRLFGGGSARLVLDSASEELGVEIEVTPPGKRIRHLTALSGGERSLAGIALLAAIVQANPSPLLVLDEVDAALDEANAQRASALLAELAQRTQIIAITHNPQTMTAATVLFGVTMDAHHVSQLVSVRLQEATELAGAAL